MTSEGIVKQLTPLPLFLSFYGETCRDFSGPVIDDFIGLGVLAHLAAH